MNPTNICFLLLALFVVSSVHTAAYNAVPTAIITQIALQHNPNIKNLQPLLDTAFFDYFDKHLHTLPLAGSFYFTTPEAFEDSLFAQFGMGTRLYKTGVNSTDPYYRPLSTDLPASPLAQSLMSVAALSAYPSHVWGRALALVALPMLVSQIHDPTMGISLVNEKFPAGDHCGTKFAIKYGSVTNLHDLFSLGLGFIAPNGLNYNQTHFSPKGNSVSLIKEEADRLMKMFPADTWAAAEIAPLPDEFTRYAAEDIFATWEVESFQMGQQIYNSILDFNPELTDPVAISEEQIYWWRYVMFRSMAKAGYRLSQLFSKADPTLIAPYPEVHPGFVSRLYRTAFLVFILIFGLFAYLAITFYLKIRKLKSSSNQDPSAYTATH